jgi:hypothetical protein
MDLDTLLSKAAYAVRMMRLARWMTSHLADDYDRRVVGRMVLVLAPIYVESAFGILKKRPGLDEADRKQLRNGVRQLRADFEQFYDRIRNDLAAHRDAMPLDLAIEVWNEIDSDTLAWFCTGAQESIEDIVARHSLIAGSIKDFPDLGNDELGRKLAVSREDAGTVRFSTDALSMTRGHAGIVPVHEVQDSATVLMSILQSLKACLRINEIVRGHLAPHLLLKSMFVIDTMNLIDGIYGEPVGASSRRSASFLSILEDGGFGGASSLRQSLAEVDFQAVEAVRTVRNKACAHLDPALPLKELQSMVLDLDDPVILDRLLNPAVAALEQACAMDMATRWLLMDETSLFAIRLASSPGVRAFDREQHPGSNH